LLAGFGWWCARRGKRSGAMRDTVWRVCPRAHVCLPADVCSPSAGCRRQGGRSRERGRGGQKRGRPRAANHVKRGAVSQAFRRPQSLGTRGRVVALVLYYLEEARREGSIRRSSGIARRRSRGAQARSVPDSTYVWIRGMCHTESSSGLSAKKKYY
jgi:hypothetical protein